MSLKSLGRPLSILVVDDDALIATLLEDMLLDIGCEVVGPAHSVRAAIALVEARLRPLDGAFLDVNLHGEVVYPIADALIRRDVPFVFVSGSAGYGIDPRYAAIPALAKPFLFEMIDDAAKGFGDRRGARMATHNPRAFDLRLS